ncbi:methionyl-tRNA formyltransferase [Brooklawnia cerclae]|uniref:Methionyl-tRNA formyltransferase n=1 Tax=Brooklawnia cerclae TaxID=349934 RepID=A0ABX0SDS4_9ACTN|nr:methionyl-tRNA formyltransferase [Brooklawnia cerclae]NIH56553.1 methionyl-tRNA formyltransferase [Brooklawnia cerclae]
MRIVFAGTPEVALPSLQAIVDAGHDVAAVITRPDAPAGRGKKLTPSPVANLAGDLGLRVLKPHRADELRAEIEEIAPEAAAVVAFGMLLPQWLLDLVPGGWVNLHFSLLPRWRGAAPVQRAVLAGDATTGATTFRIVRALDAGPVFGRLETPIEPTETSGELLDRLAGLGAPLLLDALADVGRGVEPVPQAVEGVTPAPKINPDDVRIDWSSSADDIDRLVRAASPSPGAWTLFDRGRFRVLLARPAEAPDGPLLPGAIRADRRHLWAGTGGGDLELVRVQAAGKREMQGADWARGLHGVQPDRLRFDA